MNFNLTSWVCVNTGLAVKKPGTNKMALAATGRWKSFSHVWHFAAIQHTESQIPALCNITNIVEQDTIAMSYFKEVFQNIYSSALFQFV